jgi:ESCRT-II complex subunit VPS36
MNESGMLTLTDAYSLYNRARGTDLISPEDMYRSCSLFNELDLVLRLKKFKSGLIVVILKKHSEDEIVEEIKEIIGKKESKCVSPVELSKIMNITVLLAKEQLISFEEKGILCRDEILEGINFYLNIF